MIAAKEKTFSPSRQSTFNWSPRGTYVQATATSNDRKPPTMANAEPVVSRFTQNDFRARKSKKSPIGSTVKIQFIVLIENHQRPRENTRQNRLQLRRSHLAPEMSQYRAYFVPGAMDPYGNQVDEPCPCGIEDGIGAGGCWADGITINLEFLLPPGGVRLERALFPIQETITDALQEDVGFAGFVDVQGCPEGTKCCVLRQDILIQKFRVKVDLDLTFQGRITRKIQFNGLIEYKNIISEGVCVPDDSPCDCKEVVPNIINAPGVDWPHNYKVEAEDPVQTA